MPSREDAKRWLLRAANVIGTVDAIRSLPDTLRWIVGGASLLTAGAAAVSAVLRSLPLYAVIIIGLTTLCACSLLLTLGLDLHAAFRDKQDQKRGSASATTAPPDPQQLERLIRTWWKRRDMRDLLLTVRAGEEVFVSDDLCELERQGVIRIGPRLRYPGSDFWRDDKLAACDFTEEAERIVGAILKEEDEKAT